MLFALFCTDRPGSLELRLATRPRHLAFLDSRVGTLVHAGALLDPNGDARGSLMIIDVADRAAAESFAAADPFAEVGLFESTVIRPFRPAYKDGKRLG